MKNKLQVSINIEENGFSKVFTVAVKYSRCTYTLGKDINSAFLLLPSSSYGQIGQTKLFSIGLHLVLDMVN